MEIKGKKKEVRFDMYCEKCAFKSKNEGEHPCYKCLKHPSNYDSHKPICFLEGSKSGKN